VVFVALAIASAGMAYCLAMAFQSTVERLLST
jgi:hypothetical protein